MGPTPQTRAKRRQQTKRAAGARLAVVGFRHELPTSPPRLLGVEQEQTVCFLQLQPPRGPKSSPERENSGGHSVASENPDSESLSSVWTSAVDRRSIGGGHTAVGRQRPDVK